MLELIVMTYQISSGHQCPRTDTATSPKQQVLPSSWVVNDTRFYTERMLEESLGQEFERLIEVPLIVKNIP
jgi:hypothetical protein